MSHEPVWCPVMRPSRKEFEKPFSDYVRDVFAKNPDLPMFKVVPPAGWRARRSKFPDLKDVKINTPIRQHVFGAKGVYRCIFMEQKGLTVAEFKRAADEEAMAASKMQKKALQQSDDALMERSFWSSVTINPPLYGADTPYSFFDNKLSYGWNLRDLGDLLKTNDVPEIPGVTTPMTYFGMWRSFFSWHKEDADLLSINFLHFGSPKVWYCVAPKDKDRFERMAQGMFPELHQACAAFIRHKDILISPTLLRTHNIPYIQAKQMPGEFVVLNSAAYHSGFNLGFNCAEAVNFATPEWVDVGKRAKPCTCNALKDCVRISMRIFDPEWNDPNEPSSSDDDSSDSDASSSRTDDEDDGGDQRSRSRGRNSRQTNSRKQGGSRAAGAASAGGNGRKRKRPGESDSVKGGASGQLVKATKRAAGGPRSHIQLKITHAQTTSAALLASKPNTHAAATTKALATPSPLKRGPKAAVLRSADKFREGPITRSSYSPESPLALRAPNQKSTTTAGTRGARHAARSTGKAKAAAHKASPPPSASPVPAPAMKAATSRGSLHAPSSRSCSQSQGDPLTSPLRPRLTQAMIHAADRSGPAADEKGDEGLPQDEVVVGEPAAIVGEDAAGAKFFCLVQRLQRPASSAGFLMLRYLKEHKDGLFRPTPTYWEERPGSLINVRTQYIAGNGRKEAGWKLLTLKSRILSTDLRD